MFLKIGGVVLQVLGVELHTGPGFQTDDLVGQHDLNQLQIRKVDEHILKSAHYLNLQVLEYEGVESVGRIARDDDLQLLMCEFVTLTPA